jgi:hypothetical protein
MEEGGPDLAQLTPAQARTCEVDHDRVSPGHLHPVTPVGAVETDDVVLHPAAGRARGPGHSEGQQAADHGDRQDDPGARTQEAASGRRDRSSVFTTLPVALRGNPSMKMYRRGTL